MNLVRRLARLGSCVSILAIGLVGCAGVDRAASPGVARAKANTAVAAAGDAADRGASAAPMPARTSRGSAGRIRRGDRALFELAFERSGARDRWFVRVAALDPVHRCWTTVDGARQHTLLASVDVFDHAGVAVGHARVEIGREDLEAGLFDGCVGCGSRPVAKLALRNLLRLVEQTSPLDRIFRRAIARPSIFSVIRHLGAHLDLDCRFDYATRAQAFRFSGRSVETLALPVGVTINGGVVLDAVVRLTSPFAPLALTGGVVELRAHRPRDPATRIRLRLIGASVAGGAPLPALPVGLPAVGD